MKHLRLVWTLAATFLSWFPTGIRADSDTEARQAIQVCYNQFNKAYVKKDFKTIAREFTPECMLTLVSEGRSIRASRVVADMKTLSDRLTITQAQTRIVSVKPTGDGFEVVAVWTGNSSYRPPSKTKDDPARRGNTRQDYRDTWQKTEKGWQISKRLIEEPMEK